ncbi:hypothetical protein Goarm_003430 [Gossypium armourianum]|uniref:KOW domain-containing protein n=2 Tax=Gossypium armourianum TaxID=34283 RepID=A0A7J9K344_9ROSI|nr:hypothetical protein [Gossypium armourianum]
MPPGIGCSTSLVVHSRQTIVWTPQVEGMFATYSHSVKQNEVCFDIQRCDCFSYAKACYGRCGKVRTDKAYPAGFMDVVSIPKTNEDFRLLYDTKGRFRLHAITGDETKFKLCKVRSVQFGQKGIPYLNTYDGRTIRYPDPLIKANDTIKLDLESNKIVDFIKFDVGNVVMVTGGRNRGRVGVIKNREKHKGSFETIHVQDAAGHEFATRLGNVFTIGKGTKPWVSLPKGKGIKLSIIEEARKRLAAQAAA